jgi:hypothetical protein
MCACIQEKMYVCVMHMCVYVCVFMYMYIHIHTYTNIWLDKITQFCIYTHIMHTYTCRKAMPYSAAATATAA